MGFFFFFVLYLLCLCTRLFICVLWSPAGKGLSSWFSFVVSYCEFVTLLTYKIKLALTCLDAEEFSNQNCLVVNPIRVYSYVFLFNCTTVGQA